MFAGPLRPQKAMQMLGRLREVLDITDEESIRIMHEVAAELQQYHKKAGPPGGIKKR